jgi:hypothetical protein
MSSQGNRLHVTTPNHRVKLVLFAELCYFRFGAYKRYRNEFAGVLTGKGLDWGVSYSFWLCSVRLMLMELYTCYRAH